MADGELQPSTCADIEFVCLAKHRADAIVGEFTIETHRQLPAYCARGATANHEWILFPPTQLESITIGKMEDRPPEPARPRNGAPLTR
jgi:hypothetical protein